MIPLSAGQTQTMVGSGGGLESERKHIRRLLSSEGKTEQGLTTAISAEVLRSGTALDII